ncbi:hypothetical protein Bca52824_002862 [Brassica carinata]|uniref:DUF1985 domain-containing protein n=1 Tax=Brassica carinata TaxID=52824 RepID=A0A8X7WLN3_BRACI|nr:hypothetical protein Bca52824_002862 [Brassica carinata]
MLKQDDPKAKEDVLSSVGGEETTMVEFSEEASMDEANPSTIDKSVAPGTEQSPRDADESEEDKNNEDKDVREEQKEPGEEEKNAKEGGVEMEVVQMEARNNEEGANPEGEERTTQSVREHETESHANLIDDDEEGMRPLKLHFASSQYQKSLKLSGKCYIDTAIRNIQMILKKEEVEWFIEHPQIQHFFHIKNRKQKWMRMWLLVLRSAGVGKKYELWFIVNGVPIRYSLREFKLISGLYCHEDPPNHERLGGTTFMNKYFEVKRVTYADLEKQMLAMKSKPSDDRKKMAALYFLASILVGGRKSGEGASPVVSFFQSVVDDLDACLTFPWGRYAFEHNLKDVSSFLEKCNGVVPTSWNFTSFPIPLELLAFEAIPSLRNHFRESVNGARPGCPRMCKMQYKRKGGIEAFSLNAVNVNLGNTKIIRNGKQVFFEAEFSIDFEARTAQVEGPTIPAIGEPSNNAYSGEAHADSVEAPGAEALKAMEGRLMNAFQDVMKELKDEVKSLRVRVDGMSGDNPSDQVRVSDKESEEEGDDKESEEEDGGDKESEEEDGGDYILDISNQVQLEHGSGDDDMMIL